MPVALYQPSGTVAALHIGPAEECEEHYSPDGRLIALQFADLVVELAPFGTRPVQVAAFRGRITNSNSYELNRKIHSVIVEAESHFILDLTQLEYINSTGVAILFALFYKLRQENRQLIVGGLHPFLKRVFDLMDLPDGMEVVDSVEDAKGLIE